MTNEIKKWEERFHADEGNDPMTMHMEREIAELRAKVESLAADAERYRYIRNLSMPACFWPLPILTEEWKASPEEIDAGIDAAIEKDKA